MSKQSVPELSAVTDVLDVLVVGAGPAGIFCALDVLGRSDASVLVIDRGPAVADRARPSTAGDRQSYESGVGGAGLFSDGKLCLSLDVGGHLETFLADADREELLEDVKHVFFGALGEDAGEPASDPPRRVYATAEGAGLRFKYYPVLHIGTDRCTELIAALVDQVVGLGGEVRAGTALRDLTRDGDLFIAHVEDAGGGRRICAREVVLAMGKVGAHDQAALCETLGVATEPQPVYVGARLEADERGLAPLFNGVRDPKYSLAFPDGTKIKTHCAAQRGSVLELRYEGLPVAGGHSASHGTTGRSGFSSLWNGWSTSHPYERARELMRRCAELTGGPLIVQTLADLRAGRASTPETLQGIELTDPAAVPGDLRELLPIDYFWRGEELLKRLERLCPELSQSSPVLYGPAIEWWMRRSEVIDAGMSTVVPGLSVCGDGSGWSQGIVHAAATGSLVGRTVAGRVRARTHVRT